MIEKNRLEWVIEQHYKTIDRHYNHRITTKNWCLTLWIGLLIVIASGRVVTFNFHGIVLSLLPLFLFWVIEAFQASHMKIMELRVAELEKLWAQQESKIKKPTDLLFYGSHQYQSSRIKFNMFMYALFKMETVYAFYLLLVVINLAVAVIFIFTLPIS